MNTSRLVVEMPEDLKRAFKAFCAMQGKHMDEFTINLIREAVYKTKSAKD